MSRIARTEDGASFCSNCSSPVQGDSKRCPACDEPLASVFEAMVCPSCGGLIDRGLETCVICGTQLKKKLEVGPAPAPEAGGKREEDFLLKLLEWGQGRKEETAESHEDTQEKQAAAKVLMSMGGAGAPGALPYESPDKERLLEKGREKPLGLDKPLEAAINTRQSLMNKLRAYLAEKHKALSSMKPGEDPELPAKMAKDLKLFDIELERLEKIEASVENLRKTYTSLIISQRDELERKDRDFNLRLNAFKKELARRTAEKKKMQEERMAAEAKEKEASRRMKELEGRDALFMKKEALLKTQLAELQEQRKLLATAQASAPRPSATAQVSKEQWMVDNQRMQGDLLRLKEEGEATRKARTGLQEELDALKADKEKLQKRLDEAVHADGEVIEVLKILDGLLEGLPQDKVDEFARSPEFKKYEKVLEKLGI